MDRCCLLVDYWIHLSNVQNASFVTLDVYPGWLQTNLSDGKHILKRICWCPLHLTVLICSKRIFTVPFSEMIGINKRAKTARDCHCSTSLKSTVDWTFRVRASREHVHTFFFFFLLWEQCIRDTAPRKRQKKASDRGAAL